MQAQCHYFSGVLFDAPHICEGRRKSESEIHGVVGEGRFVRQIEREGEAPAGWQQPSLGAFPSTQICSRKDRVERAFIYASIKYRRWI
jgi:hypothetical protein